MNLTIEKILHAWLVLSILVLATFTAWVIFGNGARWLQFCQSASILSRYSALHVGHLNSKSPFDPILKENGSTFRFSPRDVNPQEQTKSARHSLSMWSESGLPIGIQCTASAHFRLQPRRLVNGGLSQRGVL